MNFVKLISHFFTQILKHHKLKILLCVFLACVFCVLLFPYNELGDKMTNQLTQLSSGRVQLQYQKLGLHLLPPAISLQKPHIQITGLAPLQMQLLKIAPTLSQLLLFRPAAKLTAQGLWQKTKQSQVQANYVGHLNPQTPHKIDLQLNSIALAELAQFLNLPIQPEALINATAQMQIDPTLNTPPQGKLQLQLQNFHLASLVITGLALPSLQLKQVQVNGTLEEKKFTLSNVIIGNEQDELNGRIKGHINLNWQQGRATPGSYELFLKLNVKPSLAQDPTLGLALTFLKKYGKSTPQGTRYLLKLSGANFRTPPNMNTTKLF